MLRLKREMCRENVGAHAEAHDHRMPAGELRNRLSSRRINRATHRGQ